jgi:S1-C subfamily serine protease
MYMHRTTFLKYTCNTLLFIVALLATFTAHRVYALKAYEQDFIAIYKQASPSVVSVTTKTLHRNWFFEPVVRSGAGSGVVIDHSGHILTNYHVVEGASRIEISFANPDTTYPAVLVGREPNYDLAVLKVKAPKHLLQPANLGNSDDLQVGQIAIAIGNPFGMLGRTMTQGIISALGREVEAGGKVLPGMIQTDAPINPGNSGGALLNSDGEVIGINTLIYSRSGGSVGVGFAIPINMAIRFIPDLITKGFVDHPKLGVQVLPVFPELAAYLKLPVRQGLLVLEAVKGGAAQKAGVQGGKKKVVIGGYLLPIGGDILVAIDQEPLQKEEDLSRFLQLHKKRGDWVELQLYRGNKKQKIKVQLTR